MVHASAQDFDDEDCLPRQVSDEERRPSRSKEPGGDRKGLTATRDEAQAWTKEPKHAWSKEPPDFERQKSPPDARPRRPSFTQDPGDRAASKMSSASATSRVSVHSTDVPSLSHLQLVGDSVEFEQTSNGEKRRSGRRRNSFTERLTTQDTFGVLNTASLEPEKDLFDYFLSMSGPTILILVTYAGLLCIEKFEYFIPYDSGFAIVLLWVGALLGGQLALAVGLPPLLGMLCAGMVLKNAGDLVRGLPDAWGAAIRSFGLMNILMRGGLEMDLPAVKRMGPAAMRLTAMPGITEALCVAGTASLIFGMPFMLALALGFILGAVSPAVVVGGMFDLQARGFGVKKGVPSLVVAAASFDDVVAISGFSMCIGLAVGTGDPLWGALHGPIEIAAGIVVGAFGAGIACMTKIWDKKWKRSAIVLVLGFLFTFFAKYLHFSGAGALAALIMAALASQCWQYGFGGRFSSGVDEHAHHDVETDLAKVWRTVAEPLLFSVIGAALDFSSIDMATIPKGILVILCGVTIRTVAAFFATLGAGLNFKERLFIALAWMPKATVQAALGSVPLDLIKNELDRDEDPDKYDEYTQYGSDILTTAVFAILITAPAGLIIIQQLGPRWLEHGYGEASGGDGSENIGELTPVNEEGEEDTIVEESLEPETCDLKKIPTVHLVSPFGETEQLE